MLLTKRWLKRLNVSCKLLKLLNIIISLIQLYISDFKIQIEQNKLSYKEENLKRKIYNHFTEVSNLIVSKHNKTLDDGFMTNFNEQIMLAVFISIFQLEKNNH